MTERNPFIPGAPYIRANWVSQATESADLCAKPFLAYGKLLHAEPRRSFRPQFNDKLVKRHVKLSTSFVSLRYINQTRTCDHSNKCADALETMVNVIALNTFFCTSRAMTR